MACGACENVHQCLSTWVCASRARMTVVRAQSITRAWLLLKWPWSFYYYRITCFWVHCAQCLDWGRPQEEESVTLLLSYPCSCLKADRHKKSTYSSPQSYAGCTYNSCRLQYLETCAMNSVAQGICICPLIHAVWRLLTDQFLSSDNWFWFCLQEEAALQLFQTAAGPKWSFHTRQLRL